MKKTAYRFGFTLGVFIVGILIILAFIYLGDTTKGPLSVFFNKLESKVINLESDYVLSQRKPIRLTQLSWFDKYRNSKELINNPDTVLWGVYDNHYNESFESLIDLEDKLEINSVFIQFYVAWGDKAEQMFPAKYATAINKLGSVPFITWEPWLNDFDADLHELPEKDDPNKGGMKDISNGVYDFYINQWALDIKDFDELVFLRLGHEMNDPYRYPWGPHNNKAEDFIAAWKHIVDIFNVNGVENAVWVWSPHPAYQFYEYYYPGDEYVDWVGVGSLNYGTVALWSQWWKFDEIFGNYYEQLNSFNKPMIVTEFGSLAVGGDRAAWYANAIDSLQIKYPRLKSIIYYNNDNDNTTLNKSLDWSLNEDTTTYRAIINAVKKW